jgi:hypothetical protein
MMHWLPQVPGEKMLHMEQPEQKLKEIIADDRNSFLIWMFSQQTY